MNRKKNQTKQPIVQQDAMKQKSPVQSRTSQDEQLEETDNYVSLKNYVLSSHSLWFWVIIITAFSAIIPIIIAPEILKPYNYFRYVLGSFFSLFLPGYVFVKLIFPIKELDFVSRIVLSIGLSIIFVSTIGLVLNYSPFGVTLFPLVVTILFVTVIVSIFAIKKEYALTTSS